MDHSSNVTISKRKVKKKEQANQKRLDALRKTKLLVRNREDAIRQALKHADQGQRLNKVTKFDSDERDILSGDEKGDKKDALFGDNDDDNVSVINFDLPSNNRSAEQELLTLRSQVGLDSRFKIDEKFLDDSADPDPPIDNSTIDDDDDGIACERGQQVNILEKVLGKTLYLDPKRVASKEISGTDAHKSKKHKPGSAFMVRFDPENPDHYRFKRNAKSTDSKAEVADAKSKKEELQNVEKILENMDRNDKTMTVKGEKTKCLPPIASNIAAKSYDVDSGFSMRLRDKLQSNKSQDECQKQGFSLLLALGRQQEDHEEEASGSKAVQVNNNQKQDNQMAHWKMELVNPKMCRKIRRELSGSDKSESNDDESERAELNHDEKNEGHSDTQKPHNDEINKRTLFFFYEDEKQMEVGDKFYRTQSLEVVRDKWSKLRPSLQKAVRKKRKSIARNLRQRSSLLASRKTELSERKGAEPERRISKNGKFRTEQRKRIIVS